MSAHPSAATDPAPRQRTVAALTAAAFALLWHLWLGDAHLNEADEGYLWYGTWRAGFGEWPLRDFQAYDPGRYLITVLLGKVFGSSLLGLRSTLAVCQGVGIFFGLLAARRALRSAWPLVPLGVVLGLWLFPRHKAFDGALALALTWYAVRLLEHPTRNRHLAAGLWAGLSACIGLNHGFYAALGFGALAALGARSRRDPDWRRKGALLAGGAALGYAPVLVLLAVLPGFAQGFGTTLVHLLHIGGNVPSPWLWPWQVELAGRGPIRALAACALAGMYLLPLVVLPVGFGWLVRTRAEQRAARALVLAATVLGLLYLHHATRRSDPLHLAQALPPTLLANFALLSALAEGRARTAAGLAAALGSMAVLASFEANPILVQVGRGALVATRVGGETLRLVPGQAQYYERLQATLAEHLGPDDQIFFAPAQAAFYPLFGRRSPTWWLYFLGPDVAPAEQEAVIADLAPVDWALIVDLPVDGRRELRFRRSNALVWAHLEEHFQRVPTPLLDPSHVLFRRRVPAGTAPDYGSGR